jgi:O-glycosyl hydrolase
MAFTAKLPSTVPKTKVVAGESRIRLSSPAFPIQPAVSVQEIKGFGVTEIANNQSITYNAITNQFEPIDVSSILEQIPGIGRITGGQF